MFEALLSDVLNRFLGAYIENLDSSKLKISIWGGDVILQDLLIKQSALDALELPVRSLSGHLKCLRLKIPWSKLYTEKWEVILDGFSLVVVPKSSVVYDPLKEEKLQYETKIALLKRIEEAKEKKRSKISDKDQDGFVEKLCAQIIKNIEIEISNIHIRYEDNLTLPQNEFSAGTILRKLSIKSTDRSWNIGLDTDRLIYKMLKLEDFQFYWTPKSQLFSQNHENMEKFYCSLSHEKNFGFKFKPVLGPLDLAIQLQLNPRPEFDDPPFSIPKIILNIIFEKLSVGISHLQYGGIMSLLASFELLNRSSKFRKYRPNVDSIHGFVNLWWKYAYNCILDDIKRIHENWSWDHMKLHRNRSKRYKSLYKLKLNGVKMNQEQIEQFEHMEKLLDIFNITLCRRQAEMELEREGLKKDEVQVKKGWFQGWFSGSSKKESSQEESSLLVKRFDEEMSSDEKSKLYEAIGYSEELPNEMPPEYIDFEASLLLGEIEIKLTDEMVDDCVVLLASARKISCKILGRSAFASVKMETSVISFDVMGFNAEYLDDQPLLVESLYTNEEVPLLFVSFETNPISKEFNTSICIKAQPLSIIYHPSTMAQVMDIFSPPEDISIQQLRARAVMHLERVKERSVAGLQSAIDSRNKIDLNISISSSRVIFPEFGHYIPNSNLIVMTLGSVNVRSLEIKSEHLPEIASREFEKELVLEKMRTSSYDCFNITLKNIQIIIASEKDDWKSVLENGEATFLHLLQPLALNLNFYKCLITGDPNLPKMKMEFELPGAKLSIVDKKFIKAAIIINSCFSQKATTPMRGENISQLMEMKDHNQNILREDEDLLLIEEAINPAVNEETSIQFIELVVNFKINELKLELSKSSEDGKASDPFINFTVTEITLSFVKKTFDTLIEVSLSEISALDLENCFLPLIRTNCDSGPMNRELLSIKFWQIDPKNPDIHKLHNSVSQRFSVDTENLEIRFEQVSLLNLISFLMKLQENTAFMFSVNEKEMVNQRDYSLTSEKKGTKGLKQEFFFNVLHVKLMFSRENVDLFAFHIKGLNVSILVKKYCMEVQSMLKLFSLADCDPKAVHKEILTTEEEHTWKGSIKMYEKNFYDLETHIANCFDIVCEVEVGAIRITLIKRSIYIVLNWFDNLQIAKEAILNASEVAAKSAKESIAESYSHGQKIKLELLLKAPNVFIPHNSASSYGILLDFGRLTIKNNFNVCCEKDEFGRPSLIEQIILYIENVKISRKRAWWESEEKLLLEPLTVKMELIKNLSYIWLKEKPEIEVSGQLDVFQVRISEDDICCILSIIQGNLQESCEWNQTEISDCNLKNTDIVQDSKTQNEANHSENIFKRFTLQFIISEINVILFTSDQRLEFEDLLGNNEEFAEFSIRGLNIKSNIYTNLTVGANLILYDCTIKDIRKDNENEIRVMMEKKKTGFEEPLSVPVIDVTFHRGKENDIFVDLRISEFSLILYLPFLLRLNKFLAVEIPQELQSKEEIEVMERESISFFETTEPLHEGTKGNVANLEGIPPNPEYESIITVHIKLEKPDIILLENVSSMNSNCIFFHAEMTIDAKMSSEQRNISAVTSNLQIYTNVFNPSKRNWLPFEILKKSDIYFLESKVAEHESNIQIKFNELDFSFSPGTVEVVSNILNGFSMESAKSTADTASDLIDWSDLWLPKPIDICSLSSFHIDSAEEVNSDIEEKLSASATEAFDPSEDVGKETIFLEIDCIIITLETGFGSLTMPLIKIQSDCSLTAHGFFSSKLTFGGKISCEIAYYNPRQATWEAFLEPVQRSVKGENSEHHPWRLNIEGHLTLSSSDNENKSVSVQVVRSSSADIEIVETSHSLPQSKISLTSKDALEFTITKTFLQVLSVLSDSYVAAYKGNLPITTGPLAPYRLVNRTGENVAVDLIQSELLVSSEGSFEVENLILDSGGEVDLYEKSRRNLGHQRHSSLVAQFQDATEKLIYIQIAEADGSCIIPVKKADKRFFQISSKKYKSAKFGLVSSTSVDGGTKIVTLSGCVKVSNELESPVDVYHMMEGGTDVEYVLSINSNEQKFLPVRVVNMHSTELFFAVKGFSISVTPLQWKKLQSYSCITESLQCQPKGLDTQLQYPFFFSASCEVEQIFWKNTTLRTLDSIMININLKPCTIFHNLLPFTLKLVLPGEAEKKVLLSGSSISLNHSKIRELNIEAEIMNYFGSSWVCKRVIGGSASDLNVWTFSKLGIESKETVHLGLRTSISKGVQHLWLYCPFWMVNKTGYNLYYESDTLSNPVEHKTDDEKVILFSFGPKCLQGKKHANIKLKDSEWSEKFPLDAVGSSSAVSCRSLNNDNVYQISIIIQLSCSGLTKIVTFVPFYKAVNLCPYNIQFCLAGSNDWNTIVAGECIPIWPIEARKALHLRVEGTTQRTGLIHFDTAHSTLFKLNNKFGGVFIEVIETEGSILINFDKFIVGATTALVYNHLKASSLSFWQEGHEDKKIELNSQEMIYFTWDSSYSRRLLFISCMGCTPFSIALNKDYRGIIGGGIAGWATWMEGAQRYLIVSEEESILESPSNYNPFESVQFQTEVSFNSIGLSLVNDFLSQESMYLSMSSSGVVWEHRKERGRKYRPFTEEQTILLEKGYLMYMSEAKNFEKSVISHFKLKPQLDVDYSLMKVFKPFNRNIRRVFQPGIWAQMQIKSAERNFHLKINKLQIDNQLGSDVIFPVVLARIPPPKSIMAETVPKSFFELSIIMSVDSPLYRRFKYFTMLIQEFHLKIEMPFLFSVLQTILNENENNEVYTAKQFEEESSVVYQNYTSVVASTRRPSRRDFYHHLHLSPIKMHLSFSLIGMDKYSDMHIGGQVLQLFLQSVGVTLTEVQDVVFRLGFFERRNCWLNIEGFQSEVISHYTNQILKQIYVLILGLDVMGNPFGLVLGVTRGFGDLFYEPIQGAVEGPSEFAEGIFYGMRSFMGKTVGGAALAFSRITGTIGKGVASLTLDEDFQRQRREEMHKKPIDSLESFARSSRGVITGVYGGVTGVFTKPIYGAKEEGVEGFFKGVGKGVLGLVTRPASGMIDFASGSFDAIMRATNSVDDVIPVRAARYIYQDGIVRPYNLLESTGHKLLMELEKGRFSQTDVYVTHFLIKEGRSILLCTDKRLLFLSRNDILSQWKIEWMNLFDELLECPVLNGAKLKIVAKHLRRNMLGILITDIIKKEVTLQDSADVLAGFQKIVDAYKRRQAN